MMSYPVWTGSDGDVARTGVLLQGAKALGRSPKGDNDIHVSMNITRNPYSLVVVFSAL